MFSTLIDTIPICSGVTPPNPQTVDPRISVLDRNLERIRDLKRQLGFSIAETAKLEEYENQVQVLQASINSARRDLSVCPPLLAQGPRDIGEGLERAKIAMDLIVLAVEWELAHVINFQFGSAQDGGSYARYLNLEISDENFHGLSHVAGDDGIRSFGTVCKLQFDQMTYLFDTLKSKQTVGGQNLLDRHLALVSGGEISTTSGFAHSHGDMPFYVVGKGNGAFDTGYSFTPDMNNNMNAHGRLLLSICNAMGLNRQIVGDADKCPGGPMIEVKTA